LYPKPNGIQGKNERDNFREKVKQGLECKTLDAVNLIYPPFDLFPASGMKWGEKQVFKRCHLSRSLACTCHDVEFAFYFISAKSLLPLMF
jgi:hypothetical protein